jgi:hypothetical protein
MVSGRMGADLIFGGFESPCRQRIAGFLQQCGSAAEQRHTASGRA